MQHADSVFRRGRIVTLSRAQPQAQALAVRNGKILALGSNDDIAALVGPGTAVHDLEGHVVVPGFHDAHCHILLFGLSLTEVRAQGARSISEIAGAVATFAQRLAPGRWIRGGGYNENILAEGRHPTRGDLDAVAPEHPVFLAHVSGHMGVANSLALALAGITRDTADPVGGAIARDATGEPTGLLQETAQELIKRILPPYSLAETKAALV